VDRDVFLQLGFRRFMPAATSSGLGALSWTVEFSHLALTRQTLIQLSTQFNIHIQHSLGPSEDDVQNGMKAATNRGRGSGSEPHIPVSDANAGLPASSSNFDWFPAMKHAK
jgi:hypothetical protein